MKIVKDYELNEAVFIMYRSIESLFGSYRGYFPKQVENEIEKLLILLSDHLPNDDEEYKNYDYENIEYIMRVTYKD